MQTKNFCPFLKVVLRIASYYFSMNKQLVTVIIITALIACLIGFYSGRYYERKVFGDNFSQRRQNFEDDNFRPGGGFPHGEFQRDDNFRRDRLNSSLELDQGDGEESTESEN